MKTEDHQQIPGDPGDVLLGRLLDHQRTARQAQARTLAQALEYQDLHEHES